MLLLQSREQTGKESVQNQCLSTVGDWIGHRCARAAVQPFMKTPARLHLQNFALVYMWLKLIGLLHKKTIPPLAVGIYKTINIST